MRLMILAAAGCLAVGLAACVKSPDVVAASDDSTPPFVNELDVGEIMVHVMDPQARQFWAGWGEEYSAAGRIDVSARTDEEWKKVEDGAIGVVMGANTLTLPAYRRKPEDKWLKLARDVADLAMQGRDGAERQDKAAMEIIGGKLNVACDACHNTFRPVAEEKAARLTRP
ncbi:MAG TPA: hypothetical protein VGO52_05130 [Hyphomonadaceae bacterium]|jgi:hypothetical protein|nr:hypothetical protein [Hyphomonadaceae bacterium]